jgi:hypothetical protein
MGTVGGLASSFNQLGAGGKVARTSLRRGSRLRALSACGSREYLMGRRDLEVMDCDVNVPTISREVPVLDDVDRQLVPFAVIDQVNSAQGVQSDVEDEIGRGGQSI